MKRWTVMLIPHDRGGTHSFTMSSLLVWVTVAGLAVLSFSTAFLFRYSQTMETHASLLHQRNRLLQVENAEKARQSGPVADAAASGDSSGKQGMDESRAEYDATIRALQAEMTELYNMEAKVRSTTGLEPRKKKPVITDVGRAVGGGKGGPPSVSGSFAVARLERVARPASLIFGMTRPSADLLQQEIRLRTQSLRDLVSDMDAEKDRVARVPSRWPIFGGAGSRSSSFGYRRDPFNGHIRRHDGTDIQVDSGTRVIASARGVVVDSTYDGWFGNVIRVDHGNGISTLYAHLSARQATAGQTVERGEVIGRVGSTGRSTGPHLHYEVHINDKPVDPAKYFTE